MPTVDIPHQKGLPSGRKRDLALRDYPLTQQIDGKDAEVWIADRVLEMCKSYAAVEKKYRFSFLAD